MDMWISFGEGFLLVFAINDKESFNLLKGKHDRVLKGKHGAKCPILLVGNKQDLENERQVSYAEAKQQADAWGIEYKRMLGVLNILKLRPKLTSIVRKLLKN